MVLKVCLIFSIVILFNLEYISARDLFVKISPQDVYLDTTDVTVTCGINRENLKTPYSLVLRRNGWFGIQEIVKLTPGNKPIVGYFFTSLNFSSRIEFDGSLDTNKLEVTFKTVDCMDEAHYECEVLGVDAKGALLKYQDSFSLVVKSRTEPPVIGLNGIIVQQKGEVAVVDGTFVNIECDAHVGKPPKTMFWFKYNHQNQTYTLEHDLVGKAVRRLPEKELCRWYTAFTLRYRASSSEPEVRLRCTVGSYESDVTIRVRPRIQI